MGDPGQDSLCPVFAVGCRWSNYGFVRRREKRIPRGGNLPPGAGLDKTCPDVLLDAHNRRCL